MSEQKNMDAERAAFEAWVTREWPTAPLHYVRDALPKSDPRYGEYCDESLQRAWVGWQARASLPVGVPDGWRPVPVESLARIALFIDPDPVRFPNGDTMVFKNPHAAEALREISAEFRAMLAAAPAAPTVKAEQVQCSTCNDTAMIGDLSIECPDCCHDEAPSLPAAGSELTASQCACGDEYPANSYGAGFMAANNGICENCDAANSCAIERMPAAGSAVEEPTIVAYGDPKAFKNLRIDGHKGAPYNHEWMWAAPAPGLVPMIELEQHNRIVAALSAQQSTPERVSVAPGIKAAADFIEKKAADYAMEQAHDDMGGLSFGIGPYAQIKADYHSGLIELADELRALLASHGRGEA